MKLMLFANYQTKQNLTTKHMAAKNARKFYPNNETAVRLEWLANKSRLRKTSMSKIVSMAINDLYLSLNK